MNKEKISSFFYLFAAFSCGMTIMIIEIVGTRILAPVFGSSLYIWTALIGVTLVSLAFGYRFGGAVVDKNINLNRFLIFIVCGSGLWLFLLSFLKKSILFTFINWNVESGSIIASFILFALPLTLLAMCGPIIIKILTKDLEKLGITVGKVSAYSTIGSLLGTIGCGYYLIPSLGPSYTIIGCSCLLFLTAATIFFSQRKIVPGLIILAIFPFPLLLDLDKVQPDPPRKLIDTVYSAYSDIRVVDTEFYKNNWKMRFLFLGHGLHTIQFLNEKREPILPKVNEKILLYWDTLRLLPYLRSKPKNCLLIGLGGGVIVDFLRENGIQNIDVVEIDSAVVDIAHKYFSCTIPKENLFVEDARRYVKKCTKKYDLIILDAFGAGTAPAHLFTQEAFQELSQILSPKGLLFSNYIGFLDKNKTLSSLYYTMQKVFTHTIVTCITPKENNFVYISSLEEISIEKNKLSKISPDDKYFLTKLVTSHAQILKENVPKRFIPEKIRSLVDISFVFKDAPPSIITDEFNFLEMMNIEQNNHIRKVILKEFKDIFF